MSEKNSNERREKRGSEKNHKPPKIGKLIFTLTQ